MNRALIDTGCWKALLSKSDDLKTYAASCIDFLKSNGITLIMPWPCAYETFNEHTSKSWSSKSDFRKAASLFLADVEFLNDQDYREKLIDFELGQAKIIEPYRQTMSLADKVLVTMLSDKSLGIDWFVHANPRDFNELPYYFSHIKFQDITAKAA